MQEHVIPVGDRFAEVLREWFTPSQFDEMRRRNREDEAYQGSCCASHDFCDANMAMAEAIEDVLGREPLVFDDEATGAEGADVALWNAAWAYAKETHLS